MDSLVPTLKKAFFPIAEFLYQWRICFYIGIFLILWPLNSNYAPPVLVRIQIPGKMLGTLLQTEALLSSILFFFGILIRMLGTGYIGKDTVWGSAMRSDSLRFDGPYHYLRHPIYAGSFLLLLALSPMCSPAGALFLLLIGGGFTLFLARHEEKILEGRIPEYKNRMYQIPRFFPRRGFLPFLINEGLPLTLKRWKLTVASERYNLAFGTGFLCFSISFQKKAFWIGFILSFAILLGMTSFQKKPQ